MSEFIFLYRRPLRPVQNFSPKQIEERTGRFGAWVEKLQKGGTW